MDSSTHFKICPRCQTRAALNAPTCVKCGRHYRTQFVPPSEQTQVVTAPTYSSPPQSHQAATQLSNGQFVFSCSYSDAFEIVERAMIECGASVQERSPEKGLLLGKYKYGINPFGMTVTSVFHAAGAGTKLEINANFTDALDTFEACKKKVAQISSRIAELSASGVQSAALTSPIGSVAPSYANRAGASYKGQAVTGFCLSLGGLLVGPCGIAGLIMSGVAINGMSTSSNQSGKGWAIAGLVIGFIAVVGWFMSLLS